MLGFVPNLFYKPTDKVIKFLSFMELIDFLKRWVARPNVNRKIKSFINNHLLRCDMKDFICILFNLLSIINSCLQYFQDQ